MGDNKTSNGQRRQGSSPSYHPAPTGKLPFDGHLSDVSDIEAQTRLASSHAIAPEYDTPTSTKYLYLALYFILNLTLTLYNKAVLGKVCA